MPSKRACQDQLNMLGRGNKSCGIFLSDSTGGPLKGPACPLKALAGPVLGITHNTLRTSQISRWQGQYSCDKAVTRLHTQLRLASEGKVLDND